MDDPPEASPEAAETAQSIAPEGPEGLPSRRAWFEQHRNLALGLGCVVLCGVIGLNVLFLMKNRAQHPVVPSVAPSVPAPVAVAPLVPDEPVPGAMSATPTGSAAGYEDFGEEGGTDSEKAAPPKHYATVERAAVESCTTASVDGLSRQIIAQARCLKPNAFVPLPSRPNLVVESQVFPYLALEARDKLLKVLDARRGETMTINSALRTVAQQYLVWRWSATKRCGVPLATPPGESNHETGTALDIAEAASWRAALEANDFKWLGSSDRVHFDYRPKSGAGGGATDVLAFQMLWNRNHPNEKLQLTGRYDGPTEDRLKHSPPDGFKLGASCSKPASAKAP